MKSNRSALIQVIGTVAKRSKFAIALLVCSIAGAIAFTLLPPLVLEQIVDALAFALPVGWELAWLYFAALAAGCLFGSAREALITVLGQRITHGLRSAMCAKLASLPARYSVTNASGVTVSRFVNDVDTVQSLFTSGVVSMFADICTIVGIIVMIFSKSIGLGLLIVVAVPLIFIFTRCVQKRALAAQVDNRVAVGKVSNCIPEAIRIIRTIRTCDAAGFMERRYGAHIQEGYKAVDRFNFYDSVYSPVIMMVSAAIIAVMMVMAASSTAAQEFFGMSVGTAVASVAYIGRVFGPIESIGMELQSIQSAIAGVKRINEFLGAEERTPTSASCTQEALRASQRAKMTGEIACVEEQKAKPAAPCIQFDDVAFSYENSPVFEHKSFSVMCGEHVTLVGRTGAGKSTIFKLLLGLYAPCEGHVLVYGVPAHLISDSEKRALFGYVEQAFHMHTGSIAEQITLLDSSINQEDVERAARLVGLHECIDALPQGYDTPCDPTLFSQGQWQLLSIARAIVAEPAILLLDEITANLDSATEREVLDAIDRACAGRTVVSISHRLFAQTLDRQITVE